MANNSQDSPNRNPSLPPAWLPRRRASRSLAFAFVGVAATILWPGLAQGQNADAPAVQGLPLPVLKRPVPDFHVHGLDISPTTYLLQTQDALLQRFHAPVSFIERDRPVRVNIDVSRGTVQDVLDQFVKQNSGYRWEQVAGRVVVFRDQPELRAPVANVNIRSVPRFQALEQYCRLIGSKRGTFAGLTAAPIIGAMDGPMLTALVTLTPKATALRHFAELLGDDATLCFDIQPDASGHDVYVYSQQRQGPDFTPLK